MHATSSLVLLAANNNDCSEFIIIRRFDQNWRWIVSARVGERGARNTLFEWKQFPFHCSTHGAYAIHMRNGFQFTHRNLHLIILFLFARCVLFCACARLAHIVSMFTWHNENRNNATNEANDIRKMHRTLNFDPKERCGRHTSVQSIFRCVVCESIGERKHKMAKKIKYFPLIWDFVWEKKNVVNAEKRKITSWVNPAQPLTCSRPNRSTSSNRKIEA